MGRDAAGSRVGCTVLMFLERPESERGTGVFGAMENLSETGVRLVAGGELEVGQAWTLRFCLPPRSEELRLRARVIWRRPLLEVPDSEREISIALGAIEVPAAYTYGLELIEVEPAARERLRRFVARCEKPIVSDSREEQRRDDAAPAAPAGCAPLRGSR